MKDYRPYILLVTGGIIAVVLISLLTGCLNEQGNMMTPDELMASVGANFTFTGIQGEAGSGSIPNPYNLSGVAASWNVTGNTTGTPRINLISYLEGAGAAHGGSLQFLHDKDDAELYDTLGYMYWYGKDTNNTWQDMGEWKLMNISNQAGSEYARFLFAATYGGSLVTLGTWDASIGFQPRTNIDLYTYSKTLKVSENVTGYDPVDWFEVVTSDTSKGYIPVYEAPQDISGGTSNATGYALNGGASMQSSLTDGATIYWYLPNMAVSSVGTLHRQYIPFDGTITTAYVYAYASTAGSSENWTMYVRVNNTDDYLIQSIEVADNYRVWSNTSMEVPVEQGDYINIKEIMPTWDTNPATVTRTVIVFVE